MKKLLSGTIMAFALLAGGFAQAQTPPSSAQVAAYEGLHKAAHEGDVAEIQRLVATGADLEKRDEQERTPLHVAAFASQDAAVEALAQAGADMNAFDYQDYDVVTIAAVANDVAMVELALRLGNRADLTTSPYRGTALIATTELGYHEVARLLVDAGAPLDHVNSLGWTALLEAVILGDGGPDHIETVRILVEAGADQTIGDRQGVTALEHARARGYKEIIALLEGP